MSIFINIAYQNGELFTVWGPCSAMGTRPDPCDCPQCTWADRLIAEGKDYEEEYQKALAADGEAGVQVVIQEE